jgi:hypothetical protein
MKDSDHIAKEIGARGIRRICHFTSSRNFGQIVAGKTGVLATKRLEQDERNVYAPTDLVRLDGYTEHVCCSIEYPNAWYFERARSTDMLFRDWVVLLIDPKYLSDSRTLFSPRNAAAAYGSGVMGGYGGFIRLFASSVQGAQGRNFTRNSQHLPCCPTDDQAEVLVPDVIELNDILGIAVSSEDQAHNEMVRLELLGIPIAEIRSLEFVVVPEFWQKYQLSTLLRNGNRPNEQVM